MFNSFLLTVFTFGFMLVAANSNAGELTAADKAKLRKQAQNFYLKQAAEQQKALQVQSFIDVPSSETSQINCDDDEQGRHTSCLAVLCKITHCSGSTGRELAEVCRGVNGDCVQELCKTSHCSGSTGKEIAAACRRSSGLCVEELCKTSHCSGSTGKEIAKACEGTDGQCVVELCKTSHCSGSTGKEIARTCGGF